MVPIVLLLVQLNPWKSKVTRIDVEKETDLTNPEGIQRLPLKGKSIYQLTEPGLIQEDSKSHLLTEKIVWQLTEPELNSEEREKHLLTKKIVWQLTEPELNSEEREEHLLTEKIVWQLTEP